MQTILGMIAKGEETSKDNYSRRVPRQSMPSGTLPAHEKQSEESIGLIDELALLGMDGFEKWSCDLSRSGHTGLPMTFNNDD